MEATADTITQTITSEAILDLTEETASKIESHHHSTSTSSTTQQLKQDRFGANGVSIATWASQSGIDLQQPFHHDDDSDVESTIPTKKPGLAPSSSSGIVTLIPSVKSLRTVLVDWMIIPFLNGFFFKGLSLYINYRSAIRKAKLAAAANATPTPPSK
ncbi:hypothetical protein HDU76_002785 [Blyttiomyces sp. JEL0837]|nr:hypothetical protein HDU76_002785 [Blyttiomyces sp. JEL0837]